MTDATRFQFRLPAAQRERLEDLAESIGLSSAALTRLAICRLLDDPALKLPVRHETGATA